MCHDALGITLQSPKFAAKVSHPTSGPGHLGSDEELDGLLPPVTWELIWSWEYQNLCIVGSHIQLVGNI